MRTIKFRFTYTDGKNWIKQDFTLEEIMNGYPFDVLSDQPLLKKYQMKDSYQFTGLTDKNGVEIFDKDKIRYSNGSEAIVDWEENECFGANYNGYSFHSTEYEYEVIGNIYQNAKD